MSDQIIFRRYEIKYMLTEQQLPIIKEAMNKKNGSRYSWKKYDLQFVL